MKNPTGKKLEKIIFKLFDDASQGVDKYNHNGSLWVIFTNEMRWVVEFTKNQTLWYNYNFFKGEMDLIGLDCVEDKVLIQKWFESRFLDMSKVEDAFDPFFDQDQYAEDIIQNGVKDTVYPLNSSRTCVEDTIQNGVKHTGINFTRAMSFLEDTIENGVKQTELSKRDFFPKDIIQDGVKINGTYVGGKRQKENVEVVIDYGVKQTYEDVYHHKGRIGGMIRNGKKLN